jgi:sugar phosphate isomerase/epimerase
MPASQIACQLYTLREFSKTPADIAATLKKVKKIGYDAVQVSGIGKIDPKELANILKGEGLACCVTHISKDRMRDETQAVIDEHKMWGCKYTAIGGFFPKENVSTQTWTDFAGEYNQIAKKLAGGGLKIGYHNHSHELAHFDGKPAMQILIDRLDPSVWIEIDTYWIQHGGGDSIQWINKVKGRIPCVHLKDMGIRLDRTQFMAEVGEGNLNWDGILNACRAAGVEWYIVEQDNCNGRDPFESVAISLRNLKGMGLN